MVTTAFPKAPAGAGHCRSSPHCLVLSKNLLPSLEPKTIQPWHLDPGWADSPVTRPGGSDLEPRGGAAVTSDRERVRFTLQGGD